MVGLALMLSAMPSLLGQAPAATTDGVALASLKEVQLSDNFCVFDESEHHGNSISVLTGPNGPLILDTGTVDPAPAVERAPAPAHVEVRNLLGGGR